MSISISFIYTALFKHAVHTVLHLCKQYYLTLTVRIPLIISNLSFRLCVNSFQQLQAKAKITQERKETLKEQTAEMQCDAFISNYIQFICHIRHLAHCIYIVYIFTSCCDEHANNALRDVLWTPLQVNCCHLCLTVNNPSVSLCLSKHHQDL